MKDHIAVDIGASSGRIYHGKLKGDNAKVIFKEIFRFENRMIRKDGHCFWDMEYLSGNIIKGLQEVKKSGIDECTVGIDTWGVDYVLVGASGNKPGDVYAYRDARTDGAMDGLRKIIPLEEIYEKTGIQFLQFNTLCQLFVHDKDELKNADKILLIPDYLNFFLSGKFSNEITNASTTQLLNLENSEYDDDLLSAIGVRRNQFATLIEPGISLGNIRNDVKVKYDLPGCEIIAVASHDTASAVFGMPLENEKTAYISCGTWSLLGVELDNAVNDAKAMKANFTNERGVYGTIRFLKNISGLWLLQEVKRKLGDDYTYDVLIGEAKKTEGMKRLINCNDPVFLNPPDMIEAIRSYCRKTGQDSPSTPGELTRCIIDSLSLLYLYTICEIEELIGYKIESVHIAGGGVNNKLLCKTTCDVLQRKVTAGPVEAAAVGNIFMQMICSGEIKDVKDARGIIRQSFTVDEYQPEILPDSNFIFEKYKNMMIF
jgi:rhamnulokinase